MFGSLVKLAKDRLNARKPTIKKGEILETSYFEYFAFEKTNFLYLDIFRKEKKNIQGCFVSVNKDINAKYLKTQTDHRNIVVF